MIIVARISKEVLQILNEFWIVVHCLGYNSLWNFTCFWLPSSKTYVSLYIAAQNSSEPYIHEQEILWGTKLGFMRCHTGGTDFGLRWN